MDKLIKKIEEIFPNKILDDFTNKMPSNLKYELKKNIPEGVKLKKYLIDEYGFIEKREANFDKEIIKKLEMDFANELSNYRRKIFEEIQQVTRQRVEQQIKKTLDSDIFPSWEVSELTQNEKVLFNLMIKEKEFFIEDSEIIMYIFLNGKDCLILIYNKKNKKFRAISQQENEYICKLKSEKMNTFHKEDFENLKYLDKVNNNRKVQVMNDELIDSKNKKRMPIELYIKFLGYEYVHPNHEYTDEKIIEVLKRNIYPETEKDVYIPTDSKDAELLRRIASRYEGSIKNLVKRFGYIYHRRDGKLRCLFVLKKIQNEKNEVWFPSGGLLYHSLCQQAHVNEQITLDEYIKKIGFIRVSEKPFYIEESNEEYKNKIDQLYNSIKIEREKDDNYLIDSKIMEEIIEIEEGLEKLVEVEREVIIKQRVGQGTFREKLIKRESKCKLCEISDSNFLIASHIKPWSDSNSSEKLDVNNGFLLCPNHDKMFDSGYITFSDSGELILSKKLSNELISSFKLEGKKINISDETKNYIKFHREECFIDNKKDI